MIRSLSKLIESLETNPENVRFVPEGMLLDPSEFDSYAYWHDRAYTRNCITRSGSYELLLMCWESGQGTPIHNHGGEECWVYIIQGELMEYVYERQTDGSFSVRNQSANAQASMSYMNDEMGWHSMRNTSDSRSMSLHLYSKPISSCQVFNEQTGQLELRFPQLDTMAGQLIKQES